MHNANNRAIFLCRNLKQFLLLIQKKNQQQRCQLFPYSILVYDRTFAFFTFSSVKAYFITSLISET